MEDRRDYKEIQKAIEKYVNGGIRELTVIASDMKDAMDKHIIDDAEWKKQMTEKMTELTPIRSGLSTINNIKSFGGYWAGMITPWGIIGGVLVYLYHLIKS